MTEETFKTHELTGLVVSDKGRVITCGGKHITYGSDCNGYKCVRSKKKLYLVHRLVAETFIDNPHHLPCVNHKDENPSNNTVENLEWCTHKYNNVYGTRIQRISEKQRNDPNRSKTVYQYTRDGELVNVWSSVNECGRNGYHHGDVSACCRGVLPHYKGFIWSYEEKDVEN